MNIMSVEGFDSTQAQPPMEARQQLCNIMVQFTIVEDEEGLVVKKQIDKAVVGLNNVRINFSILQQRAIQP